MINTKISLYNNVTDKVGTVVTLSEFLLEIPKKHHDTLKEIRDSQKENRDRLKKTIPCSTISGTFTARNGKGLIEYNGLICLDFDKKDNEIPAEGIKKILQSFEETFIVSLSASGEGVYCIYKSDSTDANKHTAIVKFLTNFLKQQYSIVADKSCTDFTRLRFVSFDEDLYINEKCTTLSITHKVERKYKFNTITERVEEAIQKTIDAKLDITSNYQQWLQIAFALVSEFGAEGEKYFHQISEAHPKYDPLETNKKYQNCLTNTSNKITIGTFFYIINQNL